jgi:CRISPR/Cas system-associated exonuclease Cas4 (RecB family)
MAYGLFDTPVVTNPPPPAPTERISTVSFSRLEVFEKCPYQAKLRYLDKRPEPPTVDSSARDRGTELHKIAEDFIQAKRDDVGTLVKSKDSLEICRSYFTEGRAEVEQNWGYTKDWGVTGWFDNDIYLRVKCDVVLNVSEYEAEIVDWKSGRKDGNEIKHTNQGQLYVLAAFVRKPELQLARARFEYVDHGKKLERTYTRADVPRLMDVWTRRLAAMTEATRFPPKPNKLNCKYCPFSSNNGGDGSCPWRVPA